MEEVDVALGSLGVELLQISGAVRPRLVPHRIAGDGALQPFIPHVLKDQEEGRQSLLAIYQLPFVAVWLHHDRLEVVRLVAALPDVLQQSADLNLAPTEAALV